MGIHLPEIDHESGAPPKSKRLSLFRHPQFRYWSEIWFVDGRDHHSSPCLILKTRSKNMFFFIILYIYIYPLVISHTVTMENRFFSWENPLFLWWFFIVMLVITRGYVLVQSPFDIHKSVLHLRWPGDPPTSTSPASGGRRVLGTKLNG